MTTHCNSCGAAVEAEEIKSKAYCGYCKNKEGEVSDRASVKQGIAGWLKAWSPNELNDETALKRAELYMQSMPHWAEETN